MMNEQRYTLSCPHCGGTGLLVKESDMDEDGFVGDPVVGCIQCETLFRVSEAKALMSSDGQVIHMMRGGGVDG